MAKRKKRKRSRVKRVKMPKPKPGSIIYELNQIGKSNPKFDALYKAKPPGRRVSKSGRIYTENRANRSDRRGTNL